MEVMFVVFDIVHMSREAAFGSYDEAEEYRNELDDAHNYMVEAVEADEDLYHTLNR